MLKKMELREGVGVFTPEGKQVGKISRFVLDPATNEVTHVVVQKGWLSPEEKVVPMQMVGLATDEKVLLTKSADDFNKLPSFEEKHFVATDDDVERGEHEPYTVFPGYYPYPPQGYGAYGGYPAMALDPYLWPPVETTRNIPAQEVPLKEGAKVFSSEGNHVGNVERLLIATDSNRATHFVVTQGLLLKERKIIPVQWLKSVSEDEVHLLVSAQLLKRLPPYES
jgi:uncharacterized protein YrrD